MKLSIESLEAVGAFAGQPIARTVQWQQMDENGEWQDLSAETFVRRASCATLEGETRAISQGKDTIATRIAAEICDEHGEAVFTYEQASALNEALSKALFETLIEVNRRVVKS